MTKIVFSNEATFCLSSHVAIVRMRWLKVQGTFSRAVAFVLYEKKMFGHFFLVECTVNGIVYRDTLEEFFIPLRIWMKRLLIKCFSSNTIWKWDLPQFHKVARDFLLRKFSWKWTDRGGRITWPPLNPEFATHDFFFWPILAAYITTLPTTLPYISRRIWVVTPITFTNMWTKHQCMGRATHSAFLISVKSKGKVTKIWP